MPFPFLHLVDTVVPSETFIRREVEQLRRRGWPVFDVALKGGEDAGRAGCAFPAETVQTLGADVPSVRRLPPLCRRRFFRAALRRILEELAAHPVAALRILRRLPQAGDLARRARETESRLIHAQFAGITADLAGIAAYAAEIPWTCSVHARDVFTCGKAALRRRLRSARAVTACSKGAAEAVAASGYPASRLRVIRHGLALERFPFTEGRTGDELFTACRLETKKGLDVLLDVCAMLRERGCPFRCTIAGEGTLRRELETQRDRLGLGDAVSFPGWQTEEEVRDSLSRMTLAVLPSRRTSDGDRDGIANLLLEAMALGTPVVTTTAGSAGEAVRDGENGRLVPPEDAGALADALERALARPEERNRLAAAARRTVEAEFDGAKNILALESFLRNTAGPNPQSADYTFTAR